MDLRRGSTAAAIGLLLASCSAVMHGNVGVTSGFTRDPGHTGLALSGRYGMAVNGPGGAVGLRSRITSTSVQASPTAEFMVMPGDGALVVPALSVGLQLLQVGASEGAFAMGAGSPYVEGSVYFLTEELTSVFQETEQLKARGGPALVVSAAAGYDLRFTPQPNEFYWSVTLGFGVFLQAR